MSNSSSPPTGDPLQDKVSRLTNIIMEQIGDTDVESALTVMCNLAGQLIAAISEGKPSDIMMHTKSLVENIRCAAMTKILYDDAKARKDEKCH